MRRLVVNSFVLSAGAYVAQAALVLTYIIMARYLGPQGFGILMGGIGLAIVLSSFADFGINALTTRALAQNPGATSLFTATLTTKLWIAFSLGGVWCVATGVLAIRDKSLFAMLPLGGYVASSVVVGTLTVPLRAAERMASVAFVGLVEKLVTLAVSAVLFLRLPSNLAIATVATLLGSVAAAYVAYRLLKPSYKHTGPASIADLLGLWKSAFSFGMVGAAAYVQRADVLIVNVVAGAGAAGLYAAPARLTGLFGVIPTSFSSALYPYLAASPNPRAARREALRAGVATMALLLVVLSAAFFAAPYAIGLALGSAYRASVPVLRITLATVLIVAMNQPLAVVLQAEMAERYVAVVVAIATIIGVGMIWIGATLAGAVGAAIGSVILQAIIFVCLILRVVFTAGLPPEETGPWEETRQ